MMTNSAMCYVFAWNFGKADKIPKQIKINAYNNNYEQRDNFDNNLCADHDMVIAI